MTDRPLLSIVIPVLNEAGCLAGTLENLFSDPWLRDHAEVLISDGGSSDGSLEIAARYPCEIVRGAPGRALQMNAAGERARGERLLFLHADSRLPADIGELAETRARWGFFRLRLSGKGLALRVIEFAVNLRSATTRVAGGDQGLFFERRFFASLGGFPRIPLMEDVAICKQARRRAASLIVRSPITTSSRRWRQHGVVRTVLLMWWLRFAFWLGADPDRLHRIYYPRGAGR
ncbi:MAG: TIGR04283 family arsenosugar biosynthesis glycosyltransferase [Gammaproteobacteria bacterium]